MSMKMENPETHEMTRKLFCFGLPFVWFVYFVV
jgi:hypothetical protein